MRFSPLGAKKEGPLRSARSHVTVENWTRVGYSASVTGQEFSSKINDELTLFACNSGL
jgi:hypothetical protein